MMNNTPSPAQNEPVAWRWSDSGCSQGYDTRFSEYPPNQSPYVHDITPLYEKVSVSEIASLLHKHIKEFARWHHLNEVTIAAGKIPSDSEIDFEVTAWNSIVEVIGHENP